MFCPSCRTEYRPGFTRCADCGVDLVEHLSAEVLGEEGEVVKDAEGRELLWSGLSPRLHAAICSALDAANIAHVESTKEFGLIPTMNQTASFIWVGHRDRSAARSILDRIFSDRDLAGVVNEEAVDEGRMNPFAPNRKLMDAHSEEQDASDEDDSGPDGSDEPIPSYSAEDPSPEDATTEVWAGEDSETAEFLAQSLRGVGIGCLLDDTTEKLRVLVLPEAEKRAREVVREVVEETPPE